MSGTTRAALLTLAITAVIVALAVSMRPTLSNSAEPARLATTCPAPGQWHGAQGDRIAVDRLFQDLAQAEVVLLGESHDRMEHHRWQMHTLAALQAHRPDLIIGLEMLPREAQPVLDAWVAGELSEAEFLSRTHWHTTWGFDPQLYLPILHFARLHRLPLVAINLDRSLVERLAKEGWDAIPQDERFGITKPADATVAYKEYLTKILSTHPTGGDPAGIDRFVAAQLVWDRAMAAGLADAAKQGSLAVGILGSGHLVHGYGVPHQLRDLGIFNVRSLMPWEAREDCVAPPPGTADALFGIAAGDLHEPPKPLMLGVRIENAPGGVRIQHVASESVADQAGLVAGDLLTEVGGNPLVQTGDLVRQIRRQIPGSVLPLTVHRDGETLEILARFPGIPD
ncbi:MAG TPA: ChaN family lipoprotein [Thioalkalivibrio sp.]|nr:ChaN family lipoprotein [Thioalkalivibrio sp.]